MQTLMNQCQIVPCQKSQEAQNQEVQIMIAPHQMLPTKDQTDQEIRNQEALIP